MGRKRRDRRGERGGDTTPSPNQTLHVFIRSHFLLGPSILSQILPAKACGLMIMHMYNFDWRWKMLNNRNNLMQPLVPPGKMCIPLMRLSYKLSFLKSFLYTLREQSFLYTSFWGHQIYAQSSVTIIQNMPREPNTKDKITCLFSHQSQLW